MKAVDQTERSHYVVTGASDADGSGSGSDVLGGLIDVPQWGTSLKLSHELCQCPPGRGEARGARQTGVAGERRPGRDSLKHAQ